MQTVMWFRRDLRIQDNKALYHAFNDLGAEDELVLLFQANPAQFLEDSPNHQAFFGSVQHFKGRIDEQAHLQIQYGEPLDLFAQLKETLPDWNKIYFNEDTTGFGAKRDKEAKKFFRQNGIEYFRFQDHYLHGAREIKNQQGDPYKVFTPYYNQWKERVKETPLKVRFQADSVHSKVLFPEDEKKFDKLVARLPKQTKIGEEAATRQLKKFVKNSVEKYEKARDIPILDETSHLSRYLRTGEVSIRTVWQALQEEKPSQGRNTFEKELCWRDFYNMIFTNHPRQQKQPIQAQFRFIKWENNQEKFEKWQEGKTGFPIVDAAMRQLKETGWMHNRLRMITASFLTKDLLIDWRWGERYFQQQLIDYDPASNIGGWQWAASTGTDAVPYFRVFNPTTQSEKFDPEGKFIKKYVKELGSLPEKLIHQPDKMTKEEQEEYSMILDQDYPSPIVNHKERRKRAISMYEASKEYAREVQAHEE
ncbi:deoxyribodipyrimidine photo-lyase [Enterococcus sp.]|uniref:cryptochrome/photolyase family protein n=1 Tax=Enterococcus sp. TaxID=35783 RepID=UPI002907315A|nr:deoxyribodipyrimidine photo-lyase [Enterococcus sp.]MDU5336784.1 deoxyribodipyrimidine photo-lyase [Enterococcus sp.]